MRLLELHNLILTICKDKYAVPEMMAERITKEVNDYDTKTAELTRKEIVEEAETRLCNVIDLCLPLMLEEASNEGKNTDEMTVILTRRLKKEIVFALKGS